MAQSERSNALQAMRDGKAHVCVATDVAARGIDLPNLDLVIHADVPSNPATLLHRSGRTGRAGRKGVVRPCRASAQAQRGATRPCAGQVDGGRACRARHRRDRGALSQGHNGYGALHRRTRRSRSRVRGGAACESRSRARCRSLPAPPAQLPPFAGGSDPSARRRDPREKVQVRQKGRARAWPGPGTRATRTGHGGRRLVHAFARPQAARRPEVAAADDLQGRRA